MNACKNLDVEPQNAGDFAGCGLAGVAVMLGQKRGNGLKPHVLAVHRERKIRDGFIEQFVPCCGTDNGHVVFVALQFVGQLVGPHFAHPFEHRPVAGEALMGQHRLNRLIGNAVHLEREKHQRCGEGGQLVLNIGEEFDPFAIGGVLVVEQPRKGPQPACDLGNPFVSGDAFKHPRPVEAGEFALIVGGETRAFRIDPVEVAFDLGRVGRGIKIGQVPIWQVSEIFIGRTACVCVKYRLGKGELHLRSP